MRAYTVEKGQVQIPFEAGESSGDFLLSAGTRDRRLPTGTATAVPRPEPMTPVLRAGATKVNEKDGLSYVWIPAGTFQMGCSPQDSECDAREKPAHKVTITKGFWMGQTEVTQEVYEHVTGDNPSKFKGAKLPVEYVTWDDAKTYCEAVGMRLPTEAEWEYAARAGSSGSRYGVLDAIAWYGGNSANKTHEVGGKRANRWGLYDMLGNVSEWVADWFADYSPDSATDPQGPASGAYRSLRGGPFDGYTVNARASSRVWSLPGIYGRSYFIGFRCAGK